MRSCVLEDIRRRRWLCVQKYRVVVKRAGRGRMATAEGQGGRSDGCTVRTQVTRAWPGRRCEGPQGPRAFDGRIARPKRGNGEGNSKFHGFQSQRKPQEGAFESEVGGTDTIGARQSGGLTAYGSTPGRSWQPVAGEVGRLGSASLLRSAHTGVPQAAR